MNCAVFFYRMQQAYWWFKDVYGMQYGIFNESTAAEFYSLQPLWFFVELIRRTQRQPFYHMSEIQLYQVYEEFLIRLGQIPVAGIILLTRDYHCVLVRAVSLNKWGFPKGKQESNENEWYCAVRECKEETGLEISCENMPQLESDKSSLAPRLSGQVIHEMQTSIQNKTYHPGQFTSTQIKMFIVQLDIDSSVLTHDWLYPALACRTVRQLQEISEIKCVLLTGLKTVLNSKVNEQYPLCFRDRQILAQLKKEIVTSLSHSTMPAVMTNTIDRSR